MVVAAGRSRAESGVIWDALKYGDFVSPSRFHAAHKKIRPVAVHALAFLATVCHCLEQAVLLSATRCPGTACSKQWHTVGQSPRMVRNAGQIKSFSRQSPPSPLEIALPAIGEFLRIGMAAGRHFPL